MTMQQYTIEQLRDYDRSDTDAMLDWCADEIERLHEYRDHHEFVVSQLESLIGLPIKTVGDLKTEIEKLRAERDAARFERDHLQEKYRLAKLTAIKANNALRALRAIVEAEDTVRKEALSKMDRELSS